MKMSAGTAQVTSLDGVNHRVPEAVIACCGTGRYQAVCGAFFMPAAMVGPDGTRDCPLCGVQRTTARPGFQSVTAARISSIG